MSAGVESSADLITAEVVMTRRAAIRSLMVTILFHQAYHAGQSGMLRRMSRKQRATG